MNILRSLFCHLAQFVIDHLCSSGLTGDANVIGMSVEELESAGARFGKGLSEVILNERKD